MRTLLALIFTLSFGAAHATPDTEGLPAGSVAIVGVDIAAFRASKVGQALEKLGGMKAKELETSRRLRDQLGLDSKNDLHGLVVAIYPGADGKVAEKNASGVVLIRGKFLPARINSFGQSNDIPSKTVGRHRAWQAGAFIEKISGEKPKDDAKDAYLVAHSENLVVVAAAEFLERALGAADRKEKSAPIPAAVSARFAAAQNGWLHLYADTTKMQNAKEEAGVEELSLVIGENATDLQLALAAGFVNAEKASKMRKQIVGLQAFAMIGLSNDDGKSGEEKETLALLSELVQKIRIGGEGKQATLGLDFPADQAVKAISRVIERSQQGAAATPAAK
jgi:hypothetical protein